MIQPAKILVVDDNELNCDMLARRLTRRGYSVSLAYHARDLLARLQREPVDAVLLDIEMPEVSGLDALEALRRCYSRSELPVIMVTAKDQSEDVVRALELGANDYVTKPIDFPVAVARLDTQLSLKKMQDALRESEQRYAIAARGANDGLWDWDLAANTIFFSARWKEMLGYSESEIGATPDEWFSRIHEGDRERVLALIAEHQQNAAGHLECEHRMLHKDGSFHWVLSRGVAISDVAGKPLRMAGSLTDITERKLADPLTGLPNRLLLNDRIERLLEHARRRQSFQFALLFLDLDNFKNINNSVGQLTGDQLLIEVAHRLRDSVRAEDTVTRIGDPVTIARLGGDEFTIIVNDVKRAGDAERAAQRILDAFAMPFLGERQIYSSVSIGIAVSSAEYGRPEDLVRDAENAMYSSKRSGRGRFELFRPEMTANLGARMQIENELRDAVGRNQLLNHYQPIVSLATGGVSGFEALIRWRHPERGVVAPSLFVPIAEETGLISELGRWNLNEACRQIAAWKRNGCDPGLTMNVNISAKQFAESNLVEEIQEALHTFQLAPQALKLEITESAVVNDASAAASILLELRSLGIHLCLDDFGTGYSSLSYIQKFPFHTLKIDSSFVSGLGLDKEAEEIVRTIINFAHQLELETVAEGVETEQQCAVLKAMGCGYGQGYYFAKPCSGEQAENLLIEARSYAIP